jgi:hypothetical protein
VVLGLLALVLLTGCRTDWMASDAPAPQPSSTAPSPAPSGTAAVTTTPSAPASGSTFCTKAAAVVSAVISPSGDAADPSRAVDFFTNEADTLQSISPPAEIRTEWTAMADGLRQLADAYRQTDLNDSQQVAILQQTITRIENQLGPAENKVNTYLLTQCGISLGASAPASHS